MNETDRKFKPCRSVVQTFITHPPKSLAGWLALFDAAALSVLAGTALALEELREVEDAVGAHLLAETLVSKVGTTLRCPTT